MSCINEVYDSADEDLEKGEAEEICFWNIYLLTSPY